MLLLLLLLLSLHRLRLLLLLLLRGMNQSLRTQAMVPPVLPGPRRDRHRELLTPDSGFTNRRLLLLLHLLALLQLRLPWLPVLAW